ncbi:MAG: ATP-binding cassette domain-containing protein, partial [Pseudomonadota bacterium]|nr:ATP-binding cassette domain-containing protein [Pseudomonadota bacterium]
MTTNNSTTHQRPVSTSDVKINTSGHAALGVNTKQNSSKNGVGESPSEADSNSLANSHNLPDTVLSLQNVKVASRLWVEGLRAKKGECVHIIGPNGAGKSTLLLTLAGLIEADEGTVMLLGKPMDSWSLATLASVRTLL